MKDAGGSDPDLILAQGAARGVAVEDFGLVWNTARLKFARSSWGRTGLEPFLTNDVPYTGTSSGRLSEDAVDVFLSTAAPDGPLRILELGAGSGIFAKLFLDCLRDRAPDVYARTTYLVTDGSESVLAAQALHGVLDAHRERIESRVLDGATDGVGEAEFDAIFGTYILDSLPFDLLAVKDRFVWRKEARSIVDEADVQAAEPLRAALREGVAERLRDWEWLAPRLGLQTRHVPIERDQLEFGESLPIDTGERTIPYVHCHGALACLDACRMALREGGVAIFSDYGHLEFLPRFQFLEFQAYGDSIAVGLNFSQFSAAAKNWSDAVLYEPVEEDGNLFTRVLQRRTSPNTALQELVERIYGAETYRAQNEPLERARELAKSRYFEAARANYREALAIQPRNWAIMDEVASVFLMMTEDYAAAIEMTDLGLAQNPVAPGLWRARGEALLALGRNAEARTALEHLKALVPSLPSTWRALAELEHSDGNHVAALNAIAMGLGFDKACEEQEELLQVQQRVLTAMAAREHQNLMARANQVRALDGLP